MAIELSHDRDWSPRLGDDLVGFTVEARDGRVGKVIWVNYAGSCMVASIGWWPLNRPRLVPASAVAEIDARAKRVLVRVTKDDVMRAPTYEGDLGVDEGHESEAERYYAGRMADPRATRRDDG